MPLEMLRIRMEASCCERESYIDFAVGQYVLVARDGDLRCGL
jgi:hypothetical protein